MFSKNTDDVLLFGVTEIARIFYRLPVDIAPRVIALHLDDDDSSVRIHRKQVESFVGLVKITELFAYDEQVFP